MLAERKKLYAKIFAIMYIFYIVIVARFSGCKNIMDVLVQYKYISVHPFSFDFSLRMLRVCIIATMVYVMVAYAVISNMKNYRYNEEYGSAKFGNKKKLDKFYSCKQDDGMTSADKRNLRFTENVRIGLDVYRHNKNLNTLIIGGSGTWKTRGFVFPNLLLGNCSYVVTDPKGEILAKVGKYLKMIGYEIRVLDLKNHFKSNCYNPFRYFRGDDDILKFVNQAWESMSDKRAAKGEDIWDNQAKNMFISLLMYLYHYAPTVEQNFDTLMQMIQQIKAGEGNKQEFTAIDILFENIDHTSAAYGYYKGWSAAQGRTLASILSTLTAKLTVFNLDSLKALTRCDELDFKSMADKKVALFCVIPDSDSSYNFIAGTLYSQLIQCLYDYADNECKGSLPIHVRFIMDEFANVALPDDYEKILSTARSRNMSFAIILQNKNQIEALYEKVYKSLIGNCDEIIFLGSSELDTCKYFSELLGDETVIVKTVNVTKGLNSSATVNENKAGRNLLKPDELRKLDNRKAVLLIRGEDPVIDYKIKLNKCDNYKYMADGKSYIENEYDWGGNDYSIGSVELLPNTYIGPIIPLPEMDVEFVDIYY